MYSRTPSQKLKVKSQKWEVGLDLAYFCLLTFAICLLTCRLSLSARIVSLLPSNTEILESLGSGDEIVGVTRFDRPASGRVVVGDFFQPNLEKIISLKPDLIVSGLWASSRTGAALKKMGYRIVEIPNPHSMDELYGSIREISKSVHRESAAETVIADMKARLTRVAERAKALHSRLRAYIEIDPPFWTIGGHDFLSEALAFAGVDNIFSDLKRPSAQVSPEVIVERNPELIISFDLTQAEVGRRQAWSTIAAVKNGFVLDNLDRDALSRPSPNVVRGVEELETRIEQLRGKP